MLDRLLRYVIVVIWFRVHVFKRKEKIYKKFLCPGSRELLPLLVMGGPLDSKLGFTIASAGFRSMIVRGLMATMLAPIGPKLHANKLKNKQDFVNCVIAPSSLPKLYSKII